MTKSFAFKDTYAPEPLSSDLLEKLESLVIFHPNLNETLDQILTFVELGSSKKILLIVGPTGVGKSRLIDFIYSQLSQNFIEKNMQTPIKLSVLPAEGSTFSFRTFYLQIMKELEEPLPKHKEDPQLRIAQLKQRNGLKKNRSTGENRLDLNQILVNKRCPLMLLDEMNHLAKSMGKQQMIDHMDVPKSISEITKTKIVGFGTEGALRLLHLNSQLSRRVKPIFFTPYKIGEAEKLFNCYASICKSLKLNTTVGKDHENYLFAHSVGLIGQLSSWLGESIIHALGRKSKSVDIEDFMAEEPSHITTKSIQRDILIFDNAYENIMKSIDLEIEREIKKASNNKPGKRNVTSRDSTGGIL